MHHCEAIFEYGSIVQKTLVQLNAKFPYLCLFHAIKLFSTCHYDLDDVIRDSNAKRWLQILISHIQPNIVVNVFSRDTLCKGLSSKTLCLFLVMNKVSL